MSEKEGSEKPDNTARFMLGVVELLIVEVTGYVLITGLFSGTGQLPYVAVWALDVQFYTFLCTIALVAVLSVVSPLLEEMDMLGPALIQAACEAMCTLVFSVLIVSVILLIESPSSDQVREAVLGSVAGTSGLSDIAGAAGMGATLAFSLAMLIVTSYVCLNAGPPSTPRMAFLSPEGLFASAAGAAYMFARARQCETVHAAACISGLLLLLPCSVLSRSFEEMFANYVSLGVTMLFVVFLYSFGLVVSGQPTPVWITIVLVAAGVVVLLFEVFSKSKNSGSNAQRSMFPVGPPVAKYMPGTPVSHSSPGNLVWRMPSAQRGKKVV